MHGEVGQARFDAATIGGADALGRPDLGRLMPGAQADIIVFDFSHPEAQEGRILRFVFWHSVGLVAIMGVIVMLQAYVFPWMVP